MAKWKFLDFLKRPPKKPGAANVFMPRFPRINLSTQSIRFIVIGKRRIDVEIVNISFSGIGLSTKSFKKPPKPGMVFKGTLHIGEIRMPLDLEVVHFLNHKIGCRYVNPPASLHQILKIALNFELRAHDLVRAHPEKLQFKVDINEAYFESGGKNELYYLFKQDNVELFALTFDGYYVEGGRARDLVMGNVVVEIKQRLKYPDLEYPVDLFDEIDPGILYLSKVYVENVENLDPIHRDKIVQMLTPK